MTETCTVCTGPQHPNGPWRCETCKATFTCPTAFVPLATPTQQLVGHYSMPIVGGNVSVAVIYGEAVVCGPVIEDRDGSKSPSDRARELAETQKRRASIHIVATEDV